MTSTRSIMAPLTALLLVMAAFAPLHTAYASAPHNGFEGCDPAVAQSSGYIDIPGIGNTQKHYFYWLFAPRRLPVDGSQPPVILWMTGGPGCSSSMALLMEVGPCKMNETSGELYYNEYGWNDEAYLLFVDQPAGVGYSYSDKINWAHNESEVAEDMYNFLQGFARRETSPSITGANDFYIIGESYGGHYVPAVGYRVLVGNQRGDGPRINLKGIAVGNGLTDPYTQAPYFAETAYNWCKEKLGVPCVTEEVYREMLSQLPACLEKTRECNVGPDDTHISCSVAHGACMAYAGYYTNSGRNIYDIRKPCIGNMCYPMDNMIAFMRRPDVMVSLGAKADIAWEVCNRDVMGLFTSDSQRNFNYTLPPMLEAGIRVMIYAGDVDYLCNWIGNEAWVRALRWPGTPGFNAAPNVEFAVGGRWAGMERKYGSLSFVRVYDAGHMMPMDQPEVALYMVHRFLRGQGLTS
ncbi:hypothetical protein JKF63_06529 [Porcisia hertigi]|uniref:Carboxypeptidase n=1 Tax=Porcisia hertigi TaxID=2761500 RepID=A0A836IXK5_9TRYP|nr:hypothetical protein JKF63_06529 [Porcisia hertigi]